MPYQPHPGLRARARRGERPSARKRFAGVVAVVVVLTSLLIGPWMVFGRQPVLMVVGGVLALLAIAGFLVVVRNMTDRWKT